MKSPNLDSEVRTIHPLALQELGEEACIVALGVASDLRSGVIEPEEYNQSIWCGTSCCIAGHIATRMGIAKRHPDDMGRVGNWATSKFSGKGLHDLFGEWHPSAPILAADAIERYVYGGSKTPWKNAQAPSILNERK